jgi:hypothetical protein
MNEPYRPPQLKGNPVTLRKHRREVLWQIGLPLAIGVLLVLVAGGGVIYAGASGAGDVGRWMSISLIWLIIPALVLTLLVTVVMAAFAYGLIHLLGVLPGYTRQVQDIFVVIESRVKKAADAAVEPVLRAHSLVARLRVLRRKRT